MRYNTEQLIEMANEIFKDFENWGLYEVIDYRYDHLNTEPLKIEKDLLEGLNDHEKRIVLDHIENIIKTIQKLKDELNLINKLFTQECEPRSLLNLIKMREKFGSSI